METTDGNTDTSIGLEPADRGSAADDPTEFPSGSGLDIAEVALERAQSVLAYGRRQEAEAAIALIQQAREIIAFHRAAREGQ